MNCDTLVKGGRVVIPRLDIKNVEIAIAGGKVIALLERGNTDVKAAAVIDATGKYIMPGAIDTHVHWGHSGVFADEVPDESRGAALGGCTTVMHFPLGNSFYDKKLATVKPGEAPKKEPDTAPTGGGDFGFQQCRDNVNRLSFIDVAFHFKMTEEARIGLIDACIRERGMSSFKFLMTYKNRPGYANQLRDGWFYDALAELAKYGKAVACVHCENDEVIEHFSAKVMKAGEQGLAAWAHCRPDFAEAENVNRVLYFAEIAGCPLYVVHMSAKRSLDEFTRYKAKGLRVYAETCPQYLLHTVDSPIGILGKVQPPIRFQTDCDALWEGIADGRIDTIGSDSCATRLAQKRGKGDIWTAASSFPGTGTILPLMLSEGYHKRGISLQRIAEITSYNAANIFNLYPQKGTIEVGSDADLAIIDLDLEKTVNAEMLQGYCNYTIFDGWKVKGWPVLTMLRGQVLQNDGKFVATQPKGRYLPRNGFLA